MATGTKLMKEISDQFLICKICLEPFKEPKTLSCLHTFCCACIQQQYDAESNRPTRYTLYTRSVTCPMCRKKTDLPTGGVRRLPDNFLVSNLTEVLAKKCVSKVPPCDICHTVRPRSNDACSKCLDCDKLLCKACVELHATTKVTQDHSLIDVEGQKDIECKVHPEETVRFYCEKCEECICVVCTFQEHKDHDVCSFSDGFAKHKVALESLLSQGRERLTGVASRLKTLEKYETISKELKERIRDLAISYTSQVRAREKELLKRVDELFSGDVKELVENKTWLQESFDNLQSACNLTEIVMKDKGVEMLLLKKEIQGKMDQLLDGNLPAVPADLQLDVEFVPGVVKLGEICLPGEQRPDYEEAESKLTNGVCGDHEISKGSGSLSVSSGGKGISNGESELVKQSCAECKERRTRENKDGEKKVSKSVYTQTKPSESGADSCNIFTSASSQVSLPPPGSSQAHSAIQTNTCTVTTRTTATDTTYISRTDNTRRRQQVNTEQSDIRARGNIEQQSGVKARGTMTDRQDVRTLKTQTEESCLRDTHLGIAASTGSTYPNTGAAIAAAFLRHQGSNGDLYSSTPLTSASDPQARQTRREEWGSCEVAIETRDAEVATEISLGISGSTTEAIAALSGGEEGDVGGDSTTPDLLAETCSVVSVTPQASNRWIRSRKVQTEISAANSGGSTLGDDELKSAMFGDTPSPRTGLRGEGVSSNAVGVLESARRQESMDYSDGVTSPTASPALARRLQSARASRKRTCDVSVMTSFKVKIVGETVEEGTSPEPVSSRGVGVMTSIETRTVDSQTRLVRLAETATSTDYEGQMSKSTCTLHVGSVDAETSMPQVIQESRTTWTEATATAERATSTDSSGSSDAATCTMRVQTGDFAVQMRPIGVPASTNTFLPKPIHHHTQTTPNVQSRGTMPDQKLLTPSSSFEDHSTSTGSPSPSPPKSLLHPRGSLTLQSPLPVVVPTLPVPKADKATETSRTKVTTRSVGPSSQMQSCKTASTDTLNLLHVSEKETCTPVVKLIDEWTLTPQPQLVNTGVTPPRPAVLEVGVATMSVTLMDQATCTELRPTRESGTETCVVVCDSETSTEKTVLCDAQTEAEVSNEDAETVMETLEQVDDACMTEVAEGSLDDFSNANAKKEIQDSETQCQSPSLINKEVNTTRYRKKARECQTKYSYMECLLCQHPDKLEQLGLSKTFTDTSTDPSPPDTHDVATMALSCLAAHPGLVESAVQTSSASLYDKGVSASFEFDEDLQNGRPFLGLESQDAATSTESLPYIGLLSEIDVDELIVIPEANFELVSDTESDYEQVEMVDDETLTEMLAYAEVGTQTLIPIGGGSSDQYPAIVNPEDDVSKQLVSIGVNTLPKATFEKETSTPIRHLFSKGTMTFYVSKMDKATSTISHARVLGDSRVKPAVAQNASVGDGAGRTGKEITGHRHRAVNDKVTMTCRAEQRDMAVETDNALVDGRITQCISKLRNISERLNSPTARKNVDGDVFFGQSFLLKKQKESGSPATPASPSLLVKDFIRVSPPRDKAVEEERQRQIQNLLVETDAVLKSKDPSPVRKAQPITTLKPRVTVTPGDVGGYASRSLPRQLSADRQNKVKMGSQTTPASRLPLLRYNSAPGRIATVPAQTLLRKTGQLSPRTSPSKIPVSQKAPGPGSAPGQPETSPEPESSSSSSPSQKGPKTQQRPSLPSISETRTPSSCSDASTASFLSVDSGESSLNPNSAMTSSHSRTPSNVTSVSDTASDATHTKGSVETASTDLGEVEAEGYTSSSSASTTLQGSPQQAMSEASTSPAKTKKEKGGGLGFMQRLLSGKRKKDSGGKESSGKGDSDGTQKAPVQVLTPPGLQSQPPPSPKSPRQQKKQQKSQAQTVPPKEALHTPVTSSPKSDVTPPATQISSLGAAVAADVTAVSPRGQSVPDVCPAPPPPVPAGPPHHYPPLPDPNKTPPPPRKPRPFVYVRQRIFSIQQDNVEEVKEKKEKEKEEKEKEERDKGKNKGTDKDTDLAKEKQTVKDKDSEKTTEKSKSSKVSEKDIEKARVKEKERERAKEKEREREKAKEREREKAREKKEREKAREAEKLKGTKTSKKAEKGKEKEKKDIRKPRDVACSN